MFNTVHYLRLFARWMHNVVVSVQQALLTEVILHVTWLNVPSLEHIEHRTRYNSVPSCMVLLHPSNPPSWFIGLLCLFSMPDRFYNTIQTALETLCIVNYSWMFREVGSVEYIVGCDGLDVFTHDCNIDLRKQNIYRDRFLTRRIVWRSLIANVCFNFSSRFIFLVLKFFKKHINKSFKRKTTCNEMIRKDDVQISILIFFYPGQTCCGLFFSQ